MFAEHYGDFVSSIRTRAVVQCLNDGRRVKYYALRSNERHDRMNLSMTFCGQTYISDENFKCVINGFVQRAIKSGKAGPSDYSIQYIRVTISFNGDHTNITFTYCF